MNRIELDRGLRYRLQRAARHVSDQHRSIRDCYQTMLDAVGKNSKPEARAAFERYREALAAHFDLEERVFFPAVRGANPAHKDLVAGLVDTHVRLGKELEHMANSFESISFEDFANWLEGFSTILGSHESSEETLMAPMLSAAEKGPISGAPGD